jgi:cytochrome c oxidase cbb3-type subunit III
MMWRSIGVFCSFAASLLAQQGAVTDQMRKIWPNLPANQNPSEVARGKAVFASNCSFCHGPEATGGNGGPDLVRSVLVNHDEGGDLIGPTIRNGRPGKGMPAFPNFSDAQINDIVAFLHQRNRDARIRFSYQIGNVETGNAAAGKAFFSAHCASCHSAQGDLAGIAAKYDPDQLQQLWLDPTQQPGSQRGIPRETVTVTLPSGQKFSGTLKHLDEFDVSLYDANTYRSFPISPGVQVKVDNPMQAHEELLKHLTDNDVHNVTTYLGTLK